jgi:hypothetical protein
VLDGDVSKLGWVEYSQMDGLAVIASFMFPKRGWWRRCGCRADPWGPGRRSSRSIGADRDHQAHYRAATVADATAGCGDRLAVWRLGEESGAADVGQLHVRRKRINFAKGHEQRRPWDR